MTRVLVTGAGGSLGGAIVARLVADGHHVRGFVRRPLARADVEEVVGDLGDAGAVEHAVAGTEIVVHAGAAMRGSWDDHERATITGTAHVIRACESQRVRQLVHISSLSVVEAAGAGLSDRGPISETTLLEPRPEKRGSYTRAKLAAEKLVGAAAAAGLPCVILRPGQIFGGGIPLITGAVARRAAGRWLVLGDGALELPLVYIDDVVDAITAAIANRLVAGEVIQLVDPARLTQDDVLALAGNAGGIVHLPRSLVLALGRLSELPYAALRRSSPFGSYRLRSALARVTYESRRAKELLGWEPRVGVHAGIERVRLRTSG